MNNILEKIRKYEDIPYEILEEFFMGYLNDKVSDEEMTKVLKAICKYSLTKENTFNLTDIFIKSGDSLPVNDIFIDKHSTGGVGDKTTLVIAPIVASLGIKVPKMSGRGLGHTGGTIDKLESIPGFNVNLTEEEFINQVKNIGLAVTGQTKNLCPMDKVIYALRDVTVTVASIPLTSTSILFYPLAIFIIITLLAISRFLLVVHLISIRAYIYRF